MNKEELTKRNSSFTDAVISGANTPQQSKDDATIQVPTAEKTTQKEGTLMKQIANIKRNLKPIAIVKFFY